jgi:hypothetical protein
VVPNNRTLTLLELGGGDGQLLLSVARRLDRLHRARWPAPAECSPGVSVLLVDRQAVLRENTAQQFERLRWAVRAVKSDVWEYLAGSRTPFDAILCNLFLHHFAPDPLRAVFRSVARLARVMIAVEPRRSLRAHFFTRWLWLIGCNDVTRHDAAVSVRAGFSGRELTRLWPEDGNWDLMERPVRAFSHLFVARRRQ